MSVNGRLEFIEKEIRRFETQIKGIQEKSEKLKVEVGRSVWSWGSICADTACRLSRFKTPHSSNSSRSQHQHRSCLVGALARSKIRYPFRFDVMIAEERRCRVRQPEREASSRLFWTSKRPKGPKKSQPPCPGNDVVVYKGTHCLDTS